MITKKVIWHLVPFNIELPKGILSNPDKYAHKYGKVIVNSKKGSAFLIDDYFLKIYKLNLKESIKSIFVRNRAKKEFCGALKLWEIGIPVPQPIGLGKERAILPRKYFYLSKAIKSGVSLSAMTIDDKIITMAAQIIKRMHDAGIYHGDLHWSNFLIKSGTLYILDLHRHRLFKNGAPLKFRLKDIAHFLLPLNESENSFKKVFLKEYFGRKVPDELLQIEKQERLRQLKHVKEDCLRTSLYFQSMKKKSFKIYARKDIHINDVFNIIEKHKKILLSKGNQLVKHSKKTAISLFFYNGIRVCVKEYKFTLLSGLKEYLRIPKPRRAWRNANLLYALRLGAMKPLALLEKWKGPFLEKAFLIVESPPEYVELPKVLGELSPFPEQIKELRKAFCDFLQNLHASIIPISHKDFKAHHLFVRKVEDGWDFALIETEDVVFIRPSYSRLVKSLVQLNTSIPQSISVKERLRVLKSLLPDRPLATEARRIARLSKERGYIY